LVGPYDLRGLGAGVSLRDGGGASGTRVTAKLSWDIKLGVMGRRVPCRVEPFPGRTYRTVTPRYCPGTTDGAK